MYNYNNVTKKVAYIFVNTGSLNKEYKNANERGAQAYKLFDENPNCLPETKNFTFDEWAKLWV